MKFLIEWKESGEQEVQRFATLQNGEIDPALDDQVFYWLTEQETLEIGEDYDGGDWVVIRCACDECEFYEEENKAYQLTQGRE